MKSCYDCPRACGVDRSKQKGFCAEGDKIRVSKIIENFMWEEPCISGEKGALAIFFSGCNLRCDFCQNYQLSHIGKGQEYTPDEFALLLSSFDYTKYNSIDLITPTHFSSLLIEAFSKFNSPVPVVWNSGGYENEDMIERLSEFVDVFLPDFKYFSSDLSTSLSNAKDYFDISSRAILKMRECTKKNIFKNGILQEGVLIRHLVLPTHIDDSKKILDFISKNISEPFISIMGQFTPMGKIIRDRLKPLEYKIVLSYAEKLGLTEGYFQDLDSSSDKSIPNFD